MTSKLTKNAAQPPTGIKKFLFRLPIKFYRAGLGWLMPKRFLFLTHIGRKSGQPRYAVVEVADYDAANDIYYIVSGYGLKAQWYQNLMKTPDVDIQVGRRKMQVSAESLTPTASGEKMVQYARRYPKLARQLMSLLGYETDESEASYRAIGEQGVRFVALHVQ